MGFTVIDKSAVTAIARAVSSHDRAMNSAAKSMAVGFAKEVTSSIKESRLNVPPKKYPNRANDPRVLIDSEDYVRGIRALQLPSGKGYGVTVDVVLMKRLEFGDQRMPPRPHFLVQLKKIDKSGTTKIIMNELLSR